MNPRPHEPASVVFAMLLMLSAVASAQLDVRSDGSDGAFEPSLENGEAPGDEQVLTIDLSKAITARWDRQVSAQERSEYGAPYGRGIYDPERWAVVFKYSAVNVPKGLRIKFRNHPSRAPVVWLVQGSVTINGILDLSGREGAPAPALAEPGPGGFRGGCGPITQKTHISAMGGLGPAGGDEQRGGRYAGTYGNSSLLPLLGGSGGGGSHERHPWGGGGGGGAILIAAATTLHIDGSLLAKGGNAVTPYYSTGVGSGGGIRLVCATLSGSGSVTAVPGEADYPESSGGMGIIRVERLKVDAEGGSILFAPDPHVVEPEPAPRLWVRGDDGTDDGPLLRIVSIGGEPAPRDPRASFAAESVPDVSIAEVESAEVIIEGIGIEPDASVRVRVVSKVGNAVWYDAVHDPALSSASASFWKATVQCALGHSLLQAVAERP